MSPRYRAEKFVAPGGWAVVIESDDYTEVDAVASDLLMAPGARGVRVVDTARDPEALDPVVWSLTR